MRIEQKRTLKKGLSITAVIVAFLFFIIFVNVLTRYYSDETIRVATKTILESWSGAEVSLHSKTIQGGAGIAYSRGYSARIGDIESSVYIVAITGRTGPYSAVFAVRDHGDAEFCGLLLEPELHSDYEKLGISQSVINKWTNRITRLNTASRGTHEK